MICGGTASAQPADEETQKVIEEVKQAVEEKLSRTLEKFEATQVARQLVQGTNYFVKVHIGDDKYIHLRVYKNLPCYGSKIELHGMQNNKSSVDEIGYFEGFSL